MSFYKIIDTLSEHRNYTWSDIMSMNFYDLRLIIDTVKEREEEKENNGKGQKGYKQDVPSYKDFKQPKMPKQPKITPMKAPTIKMPKV
jgi:beta-galactosidase/beta-glucuronidase